MRVLLYLSSFLSIACSLTLSFGTGSAGSDRKLYINGVPFFMKGVNYNPVSIGYQSYQLDPYANDAIVNRDIPLLAGANVNAVRLQNFNTFNYKKKIEFLNKLYQNNMFAILSYHFDIDQNWNSTTVRNSVKSDYLTYYKAYYTHPSVLMILFGNELNYGKNLDRDSLFSLVDEVRKEVHLLEGSEHWHPFATTVTDINLMSHISMYDYAVDMWAIQVYRGSSFGNLFSEYAKTSKKPMLLSEYGFDAWYSTRGAEDQETQRTYLTSLYSETVTAARDYGYSGGFIFKFQDDWSKRGTVSTHDAGGWVADGFPDKMADEEYWGLLSISKNPDGSVVDVMTKRLAYEDISSSFRWSDPYGVNFTFPTLESYPTVSETSTSDWTLVHTGLVIGAAALFLVIGTIIYIKKTHGDITVKTKDVSEAA